MDNSKIITMEDLDKRLDEKLSDIVGAAIAKAIKPNGEDFSAEKSMPMVNRQRGTARFKTFATEKKDKGIAAARMIRALAFGNKDPQRAIHFAKMAWDDDLGDEIVKALGTSDHTAGGALVPTEFAAEIIELLRSMTVVRAAGARTIPMNNGAITIRKQTAAAGASYVGEHENITATEPQTGQIDLVARKLAAVVPISNDLLAFTSGPSADEFVRDDLVLVMSIREDRAFIRDEGINHTPKGLRHWALNDNVLTTNGETATNIEDDFKDMINALETRDVRMIRPAWFMNPRSKNHLRNLRDANGNLIFPETRNPSATLYGWPIWLTTSIPINLGVGTETELYLVDMVDTIIGEATSLEIAVDSSASYWDGSALQSTFSRDETAIRAIQRHDFAVRHPESISIKQNVIWGA